MAAKVIITQIVKSDADSSRVLDVVEEAFRSISSTVQRDAQCVVAEDIQTDAFGSGFKKDVTRISIKEGPSGWLITAEHAYSQTLLFTILIIANVLFFLIGCIPLWWLFYRNKNLVRKTIDDALRRVRDELEHENGSRIRSPPQPSNGFAGELEQLSELHKKGLLSVSEFDSAKRKLLGSDSTSLPAGDLIVDESDDIVFVRRDGKVSSKQFRRHQLRTNISQLRDSDEFGLSAAGPWFKKKRFFDDEARELGIHFNSLSYDDFLRHISSKIKGSPGTRFDIIADWHSRPKTRSARALVQLDLPIDSITIRATEEQYNQEKQVFQGRVRVELIT